MNKLNDVKITILSNLLLQFVTAICGFILPPLIISHFGSTINGMVSSITQFISYLNIVEAGVGAASIVALYKPLAENDVVGRNNVLTATKRLYNRSGLIFVILVLILSLVYPQIVADEVKKSDAGLMVLILGISGAAEFFLIGKFRVLLTADKKIYVISLIQVLAVIVNTFVAVVLIKFDSSILIVKLFSSLIYLSRYFFILLYIKVKYKDLSFSKDKTISKIEQSNNVLIHQIAGLAVFNSPVVIITIFCTLVDASIYSVYALVFTALNSLLGSFTNGMQAFLGDSIVKNENKQLNLFYKKFENLVFFATFWAFSLAYILIIPFMKIYTKNLTDGNYVQSILGLLFCIAGLMYNLRGPGNQLIYGAGHFKKTQNRAIIEMTINIICSVLFTIKFGMIGVLLGSISSHTYRLIDTIIYTSKYILMKSSKDSFVSIFILAIVYLVLIFIAIQININVVNYFQWFIYAIVLGIIFALPFLVYKLIGKIKKSV